MSSSQARPTRLTDDLQAHAARCWVANRPEHDSASGALFRQCEIKYICSVVAGARAALESVFSMGRDV